MSRYRKSELLELISNMYLNSGENKKERVFPEAHDILMFTDKSIEEIIDEIEEWRERYEKYSGGATSDRFVEESIRKDIDVLYTKGRKFLRDGDFLKAKSAFDKADGLYFEVAKELLKISQPMFKKIIDNGKPLPLLSGEYLTKNDLW